MFDKLTIMNMARKRMDWVAERNQVLAENVANANTPKYTPKDLKPLSFKEMVQDVNAAVKPTATHASHVVPEVKDPFKELSTKKTFESSPDGNAVVLEEQMAKVGESKTAYETAAALFQKQMRMIRMAVTGSRG